MLSAFVLRRLVVVSVIVLVPMISAASSTSHPGDALHLDLNSAEPGINDTVATSPKVLKLWFTEPITAPKTSVRLTNARNEMLKLGKLTVDTPPLAPAVVPVLGPLRSGKYTVTWRASGDDGHPSDGKYTFVVK